MYVEDYGRVFKLIESTWENGAYANKTVFLGNTITIENIKDYWSRHFVKDKTGPYYYIQLYNNGEVVYVSVRFRRNLAAAKQILRNILSSEKW